MKNRSIVTAVILVPQSFVITAKRASRRMIWSRRFQMLSTEMGNRNGLLVNCLHPCLEGMWLASCVLRNGHYFGQGVSTWPVCLHWLTNMKRYKQYSSPSTCNSHNLNQFFDHRRKQVVAKVVVLVLVCMCVCVCGGGGRNNFGLPLCNTRSILYK